MATAMKLGWIGIGRMGYAMAERLARAGADLTVWNRNVAAITTAKELDGLEVDTTYIGGRSAYQRSA
jgi:3-hydroxyisobutyrate dehydrogenase